MNHAHLWPGFRVNGEYVFGCDIGDILITVSKCKPLNVNMISNCICCRVCVGREKETEKEETHLQKSLCGNSWCVWKCVGACHVDCRGVS